jgi:hypothetical protein
MLNATGAVKQISDFNTYAMEHYIDADALKSAYRVAAAAAIREGGRSPFLVYAVREPEFLLTRNRLRFSVQTTPLGYFSRPKDEEVCVTFYFCLPVFSAPRYAARATFPR